nr:MAG TPA: hypothetical protein [Caudoviricetes sp.]
MQRAGCRRVSAGTEFPRVPLQSTISKDRDRAVCWGSTTHGAFQTVAVGAAIGCYRWFRPDTCGSLTEAGCVRNTPGQNERHTEPEATPMAEVTCKALRPGVPAFLA